MEKTGTIYTLRLYGHFIRHCNPEPKTFYDSLMLQNGGKLILKEPKNLDKVVDRVAFTIINEE